MSCLVDRLHHSHFLVSVIVVITSDVSTATSLITCLNFTYQLNIEEPDFHY